MTTDERIERVAAALCAVQEGKGYWSLLQDAAAFGDEADSANEELEWLREQARVAIAAMDAEPLDVMMQDAGLVCIQVDLLYTGRPTDTWQAMALRRDEEWGAEEQPHGHGETPMDAIREAVRAAKEAT